MKKNDSHGPLSAYALDIAAMLRPIRVAFLVDLRTHINWFSKEIIPRMCAVWGGAYSAVIVLDKESTNIDADSKMWMELLSKFDPDFIVSTDCFSAEVLGKIAASCLLRAEIFQFDERTVCLPAIVDRCMYSTVLEKVIDDREVSRTVVEYQVAGDDLVRALFFSKFGRLGKHTETFRKAGANLTVQRLQEREALNWVDEGTRIINPRPDLGETHFGRSMRYLGTVGACDHVHHFDFPNTIIIGDSISDMALFMTLCHMIPKVHWIPVSFLKGKEPKLMRYLIELINNDRDRKNARVVSASLKGEQLRLSWSSVCINKSYRRYVRRKVEVVTMVELVNSINNWWVWMEINNHRDESLLINQGKCFQKLPTLVPKNFRVVDGDLQYRVEILFYSYSILSSSLCKIPPLEWRQPRAIVPEDSKKSVIGGVSFNPLMHLRFGGQEIESLLHAPRFIMQDLFTQVEELFGAVGRKIRRSANNQNLSSVLELWNQSLNAFDCDYRANDTSKIFDVFKAKNKSQREKIGLKEKVGIRIRGEYFCFSKCILDAFDPPLASFTFGKMSEWLNSRILIRGECLTCSKCGFKDFYREDVVDRFFTCKRCDSRILRNLDSMGYIEPRFLYDLNPVIRGLQESNSDLILLGAKRLMDLARTHFDFETEIEIMARNSEKTEKEIDIIANLDGALVIGEAKTNGQLAGKQLSTYVDICEQLSVSVFFVICEGRMKDNIKNKVNKEFQKLPGVTVKYIEV